MKSIIYGKTCHIFEQGSSGPVVFLGVCAQISTDWDNIFENVCKITNSDFVLIAYEVCDWNAEFSPWRAKQAFGDDDFKGEGIKTKKWLIEAYNGFAVKEYPNRKYFLSGYSLAGLFSLWAFYETGLFDGVASCSGSLWFEGWEEYARKHFAKKSSVVYLSLGSKEDKTRNVLMSNVGSATNLQYELLLQDECVTDVKFELNQGGHFNETAFRTAKGIAWLVSN